MSSPRLVRAAPLGLLLLLLTRLALGATYSLVVPIWESYDEDGHFAYIRYLATYRQLLDPADPEAQAVYENFQAPLYYILVAPFLLGRNLGESVPQPERNPYWAQANAGDNYALHPPHLTGTEAEVAQAVIIARLVGVFLSTLSVVFVFDIARRVWATPTSTRWGPVWAATLLYAFWPQFLFTGSMLSNDLAVTTFSAGVLALAVQLVTAGFQVKRLLGLALLFAAAVLSKLNALALLPLVVAAALISLAQRGRSRPARPWLGLLVLAGLVTATLAGLSMLPYVTAQVLRVEVLMRFLTNLLGAPDTPELVFTAAAFAFRTFFASFGWGKVNLPPWLYLCWSAAAAVGALGLAFGVLRRLQGRYQGPDHRLLLLLGLFLISQVSIALALVVALQDISLAPGRYLLPSLPAVAVLLVEGFRRWLPPAAQRWFWRGLSVALVLLGWSIPLTILMPTYALPQSLRAGSAGPAAYRVGEAIELLSYDLPEAVEPGQDLPVGVCWRTAAPLAENYAVALQVIAADGLPYGELITYPGRGNFPTRFWTPGVAFCDQYAVPIEPTMPAPSQATLQLTVLPVDSEALPLPITAADGRRLDRGILALPVRINRIGRPPAPDQALDYRFGNALWLRGYSLAIDSHTRAVRVTLQWQALHDLTEDYVVFVHLRDRPDTAYAQSDQPGGWPWLPTHLWRQGDIIEDTHHLTLPPGLAPPLTLYVGVVLPREQARLFAQDANGHQLLNDELLLLEDWVLGKPWALPTSLAPP